MSTKSKEKNHEYEIIKSQRRGDLLIRNGYRYTIKCSNSNGHVVWRCTHRKICTAVLVTSLTVIIKEQAHSCQPDIIGNEVKKKLNETIERAENESTPMPTLYSELIEELNNDSQTSQDVLPKIPNYENLKKCLYKHRNTALGVKKTRFFKTIDVCVPPIFNDFLLADYCFEDFRILMFATSDARDLLEKSKIVFCDGTFK